MKREYIFLLIGLFIGALFAWGSVYSADKAAMVSMFQTIEPIRQEGNKYQFINPLLACDLPESIDFDEYTTLEGHIKTLIAKEKDTGEASEVSVYVKELTRGRWVGIDENIQYNPASLMKVVLMIAYFKDAKGHPEVLTKKLTYTQALANIVAKLPFEATSSVLVGESYSVDELIKKMIISSDNNATYTLLDNLNQTSLSEVFTDLGLPDPNATTQTYKMSAKDYSLFFRVLYNATYLGRTYSERALGLLTQATFKNGLSGGVPEGTTIAHKYGVREITTAAGDIQTAELHDCGIVYAPNHPYFLCVMTRGTVLSHVEKVVADLSSLVYADLGK